MNQSLDIKKHFIDVVDKVVTRKIDGAEFDKTFDGRILTISDDKYVVNINGQIYKIPFIGSPTHKVNDVVHVKAPLNDFDRLTLTDSSAGSSTTGGGSSSSGTTNYNDLYNIPSINGITLKNNKTADELGLAKSEYRNPFTEQQQGIQNILNSFYLYIMAFHTELTWDMLDKNLGNWDEIDAFSESITKLKGGK